MLSSLGSSLLGAYSPSWHSLTIPRQAMQTRDQRVEIKLRDRLGEKYDYEVRIGSPVVYGTMDLRETLKEKPP